MDVPRPDWADVQRDIVQVLDNRAAELRTSDPTLVWRASGDWMRYGALSCALTVSHRGAMDPNLEVTVKVTGEPGALRLSGDIGRFGGEVLAELERTEPFTESGGVVGRLRDFLDRRDDLLRQLALEPPPDIP
jgi:hypothetical protein